MRNTVFYKWVHVPRIAVYGYIPGRRDMHRNQAKEEFTWADARASQKAAVYNLRNRWRWRIMPIWHDGRQKSSTEDLAILLEQGAAPDSPRHPPHPIRGASGADGGRCPFLPRNGFEGEVIGRNGKPVTLSDRISKVLYRLWEGHFILYSIKPMLALRKHQHKHGLENLGGYLLVYHKNAVMNDHK